MNLGHISCSPAVAKLTAAERAAALDRHAKGDWGDIDDGSKRDNDDALAEGDDVISCYVLGPGKTLIIQTDGERAATFMELRGEPLRGNAFKDWKRAHGLQ